MSSAFTQSSFLGGEISQTAQGRIDEPRYRTCMNVCLNGFPVEQGAWLKRSGFLFASYTRNGQTARLYPFDFEQDAPYNIEFTNGFVRFYQGNALVMTND